MLYTSARRWFEETSIAFDAGDGDLYRYVGNDPTNEADPTGLDPNVMWEQVFPPKAGNYGAFCWPIKWSLAKDAPGAQGNGIIMQRIDVKVDIKRPGADGKGSSPVAWGFIAKGGAERMHHWFETWLVTNGEVDKTYVSALLANKDVLKLVEEDYPDQLQPVKDKNNKMSLQPVFQPQELDAQAHDWFSGFNVGRAPPSYAIRHENEKTWGYISVTAQAYFYPGMTLGDLKASDFKPGSLGWSGSIALPSYAWPADGPEGEKIAMADLEKEGMIFGPGSNFTKFWEIPAKNLAIRHFVVYWDSTGETKILQGKEAEDVNLDDLMKRLKP